MNFRYLLLLLLLPCMLCSAQTLTTNTPPCNASFEDTLTVRALDAGSAPIQGAAVYVYYQYSGSVGANGGGTYYTAGPLITNDSGVVQTTIVNVETDQSLVDCNVDINALVGGVNSSTSIVAIYHPPIVDVNVPVYPVVFHVTDSAAAPLAGATVWFGNQTETTDAQGFTKFYTSPGQTDYLVSYGDGKQQGSMMVSNDVNFGAVIRFYPVTIQVIDDMGKPLNATLATGTKVVQLSSNGTYYDPRIFGNSFQFNVSYAGVVKDLAINPGTDSPKKVIFDFTSPTIGSIGQSQVGNATRLTIPVTDPGVYPSGVDPASVSVTYKIESAAQWSRAIVFTPQNGVFVADFPEFPPDSVIQFKVEVADLDGNKASVDGTFSTPPAPAPPANISVSPPPQAPQGQGLPLLDIAGGVVLLIFLVYMFYRLKGGGDS